jgi:hypothetical protein
MVWFVDPATVGIPVSLARDKDASNTSVNPVGKLVEEISVIGTLLVKKVRAVKKVALESTGTFVYKIGTVDKSNNIVSPNEKVNGCVVCTSGGGKIRDA